MTNSTADRLRTPALLLLALLLAACASTAGPPAFAEVENVPVQAEPTPTLTLIPTRAPVIPSATPTASPTPEPSPVVLSCEVVLEALYTAASNACPQSPGGYICNGGLPPEVEPAGPIRNALAVRGALVEAALIKLVHTRPLLAENSGGVAWIRLRDGIRLSMLLLGDVEMRDVTPPDAGFPVWQSFTVRTSNHETDCGVLPRSALFVQSPYDQQTRVVINGVSVDLEGSIIVQTEGETTVFIQVEGLGRVTVFGQPFSIMPGQQIAVPYEGGSFARPAALPPPAGPLDYSLIEHLPVGLLQRPELLPQPGYVTTQGTVNMRAEPRIDSRLIFQVPPDQIITVLGRNPDGDWYHVRLGNGETGWMLAELLIPYLGVINHVYESTPLPPQRYGELGTTARVIIETGGNLRQSPDVSFPVLSTLPYGTEVKLLARSPYSPWVKVEHNGQVGWMALLTVETRAALGFLPEIGRAHV